MWQEVIGLKCLLQEVTVEAREENGTVKESVLVEKQRGAKGGALRNTSIWSPEEDKELRGRKRSGQRRILSVVEASVLCNTFLVYTQMFADGLIVSPHEQGLLCLLAHKCILNA